MPKRQVKVHVEFTISFVFLLAGHTLQFCQTLVTDILQCKGIPSSENVQGPPGPKTGTSITWAGLVSGSQGIHINYSILGPS